MVWQTIRSCDHNLKVVAPLAQIGCLARGERSTPESALVIGRAWRVGAADGVWIERWVTLDVNVESNATRCLVTRTCALQSVVAGQGVEAHVARSAHGASKPFENLTVPVWGYGVVRCGLRFVS